jgi:hypothetical protein
MFDKGTEIFFWCVCVRVCVEIDRFYSSRFVKGKKIGSTQKKRGKEE